MKYGGRQHCRLDSTAARECCRLRCRTTNRFRVRKSTTFLTLCGHAHHAFRYGSNSRCHGCRCRRCNGSAFFFGTSLHTSNATFCGHNADYFSRYSRQCHAAGFSRYNGFVTAGSDTSLSRGTQAFFRWSRYVSRARRATFGPSGSFTTCRRPNAAGS